MTDHREDAYRAEIARLNATLAEEVAGYQTTLIEVASVTNAALAEADRLRARVLELEAQVERQYQALVGLCRCTGDESMKEGAAAWAAADAVIAEVEASR